MSSPTDKAASQDPVTSEMLSSRESDQSTQKSGADDSHGSAREKEGDAFPEKQSENKAEKNEKQFEDASAVVARHVRLLREYNEIKDVGQQLMGMVAEKRGVTVGRLYKMGEFGVGPKD